MMVATAAQILHEQNFKAKEQVKILIGHDRVIRINIDGICALRIRIEKGCEVKVDQP